MGEWVREWSDWMPGWMGEWVNGWMGECPGEWVNVRVNGWMGEWVNARVNGWMGECYVVTYRRKVRHWMVGKVTSTKSTSRTTSRRLQAVVQKKHSEAANFPAPSASLSSPAWAPARLQDPGGGGTDGVSPAVVPSSTAKSNNVALWNSLVGSKLRDTFILLTKTMAKNVWVIRGWKSLKPRWWEDERMRGWEDERDERDERMRGWEDDRCELRGYFGEHSPD